MPGTVPSASSILSHLFLQQHYELSPFISTVFPLRQLACSHTVGKWGRWDPKPGHLTAEMVLSSLLRLPTTAQVEKQGDARMLEDVCTGAGGLWGTLVIKYLAVERAKFE